MSHSKLSNKIIKEIEKAAAKNMLPALAYDRVSTTEQASQGMSLEYQSSNAQKYAALNNLYIVHTYSATESAFKEGRKNFNEMLTIAEQFGIKHIIFKNTDRLGRNDIDWPRCKKLAREKGFNIHLYELSTIFRQRSTAEEEMFLDNTSSMAKYWSNKISQSVRNTFHYKASMGVSPGPSPYGYKYDGKNHVIDYKAQKIVRKIFSAADRGKSIYKIMDLLNDAGHKTIRGGKWNKSSVHRILTSPFYTGRFDFQGELWPGNHEPYCSIEKYATRLVRLGERCTGGKGKIKFHFSGILINGKTGRTLTGERHTGAHNSGEYIYYTHHNPNFSIKEDKIIKLIDDQVDAIEYSKKLAEFITEIFRQSVDKEEKEKSIDMGLITKKIARLEIENQKLIELLIEGIDPKTVKAKIDSNRKTIERLEKSRQAGRLDNQKFIFYISDIVEKIRHFPEIYRMGTAEEKAEGIRAMADHITIYDDRVEISWKQPFSFILNPEIMKHFDGGFGNRTKWVADGI